MSEFNEVVDIDAPAEAVWTIMMDVERWTAWTRSISRVTRLDPGPLGTGSQVKIRQPRLPDLVWTVDAFEDGRYFSWRSASPGIENFGSHRVTPTEVGCRLELVFRQSGPLAWLARITLWRLTKRYVRLEARGLKRQAERSPQAPAE
jgi:uncharacterized membrane protein